MSKAGRRTRACPSPETDNRRYLRAGADLAHEAGHAVGEAGLPLALRETLEDLGHAYEPGGKAGLRAHGTAGRVPGRTAGVGQSKAFPPEQGLRAGGVVDFDHVQLAIVHARENNAC